MSCSRGGPDLFPGDWVLEWMRMYLKESESIEDPMMRSMMFLNTMRTMAMGAMSFVKVGVMDAIRTKANPPCSASSCDPCASSEVKEPSATAVAQLKEEERRQLALVNETSERLLSEFKQLSLWIQQVWST